MLFSFLIYPLATGQLLTSISEGTAKDVDLAVTAAQKAFDTVWGLHTPGNERGRILSKWADLIEAHVDELAAIESLNNGRCFAIFCALFLADFDPALFYLPFRKDLYRR